MTPTTHKDLQQNKKNALKRDVLISHPALCSGRFVPETRAARIKNWQQRMQLLFARQSY